MSGLLSSFLTSTGLAPQATQVKPWGNDGSLFYLMGGSKTEFPYQQLFQIFRHIPQVNAVVSKKASLFSNVEFEIIDTKKEDEVLYNHPLSALLAKPNPHQTWRQMLYMISIYKSVAGVSFVVPTRGALRGTKGVSQIWPIDFQNYEIDKKLGKMTLHERLDIEDRAVVFSMEDGANYRENIKDLMVFKDSFSDYLYNYSRITTLKIPIENIYKALVNRGILIEKKGGIGILSGNQKDGGVAVPFKKGEKDEIQRQANSYGLGPDKEPIIITDVPLRWQPMTFPTRELMLFEEIEDDVNTILDVFGIHRETMMGNATFSNKAEADRATYVDTIIPEWADFFAELNHDLETSKENIKIVPKFAHIPALTENEKEKADVESVRGATYRAEMEMGIIDEDEYREQMGYEPKKKNISTNG